MSPGAKKALLVLLAGRKDQTQSFRLLRRRGGAKTTRCTAGFAAAELIAIDAMRLQARDFDSHRMRPFGSGHLDTGLNRGRAALLCDVPAHGHRDRIDTAIGLHGLGRQTSPDDCAIRTWPAAGHTERERIVGAPPGRRAGPIRQAGRRARSTGRSTADCGQAQRTQHPLATRAGTHRHRFNSSWLKPALSRACSLNGPRGLPAPN